MKKLSFALLLALMLLNSACSTSQYLSGQMISGVQQGMTPAEVRSIFKSEPHFRRFEGNMEEWEYRKFSPLSDVGWSIILIQFTDGRVSGMDSFKDRSMNLDNATLTRPSPTVISTIDNFPPVRHSFDRERTMDGFEFRKLLDNVKYSSTNEKKRLIETALQQYDFTSKQAKELVEQISFTSDQKEMMIKIYPYIVDKQNFEVVIGILGFGSDREEVRKALRLR